MPNLRDLQSRRQNIRKSLGPAALKGLAPKIQGRAVTYHGSSANPKTVKSIRQNGLRQSSTVNETQASGSTTGLGVGAYTGPAQEASAYALKRRPKLIPGRDPSQQSSYQVLGERKRRKGRLHVFAPNAGAKPRATSGDGANGRPGEVNARGEAVWDPKDLGKPIHSQNENVTSDVRRRNGQTFAWKTKKKDLAEQATYIGNKRVTSLRDPAERARRLEQHRVKMGRPTSKPSRPANYVEPKDRINPKTKRSVFL